MKSRNKSLAKASVMLIALTLLGVSQTSFAGGNWRRDCQAYKIAGITVRTCERNYRHRHHYRPRHHHRYRPHQRVCRTWHDRWGFHRRCTIN